MSTITTHELAGQRLAQPITHASLLGPMYARAWLELVAEDHSYAFCDPYQRRSTGGQARGPGTAEIMWMQKR